MSDDASPLEWDRGEALVTMNWFQSIRERLEDNPHVTDHTRKHFDLLVELWRLRASGDIAGQAAIESEFEELYRVLTREWLDENEDDDDEEIRPEQCPYCFEIRSESGECSCSHAP